MWRLRYYSNSGLQSNNALQKSSLPSYRRAGLQTSSRVARRCKQGIQRVRPGGLTPNEYSVEVFPVFDFSMPCPWKTLKGHVHLYVILRKKEYTVSYLSECSYESLGKTQSASFKFYSSMVSFRWETERNSSLQSMWGPLGTTSQRAFSHF